MNQNGAAGSPEAAPAPASAAPDSRLEGIPIQHIPTVYELRRDTDLLRDQVDALQVSAAEKRRPWYRDHSTLISLSALLLSTIFSLQAVHDTIRAKAAERNEKTHAEIRTKLETLRQFMVQVADIRNEEVQEQSTTALSSPALYGMRSSARNAKRQILLESADAIVTDVREHVSAQVLNTLAFEHSMDSRFHSAERYYRAALAASSDSANATVVSLGGLAMLYMTPGNPLHAVDKGRSHWAHVMTILDARRDEYGRMQRAHTLMQMGWAEMLNGNRGETARLVGRARAELREMSPQHPGRQQILGTLAATYDEQGYPHKQAAPEDSPLVRLAGLWDLRYPGNATLRGRMQVLSNAQNNTSFATVEVLDGDRLVLKYSGALFVEDSATVRIDWMGTKLPGAFGPVPTSGITRLRLRSGAAAHSGSDYELGAEPVSFRFARKLPREYAPPVAGGNPEQASAPAR